MGRERRRRSRRATAPRPAPGGQSAGSSTPAVTGAPRPPAAPVQVRSNRVLARESANMLDELKRVALVSGVCFGMLGVLIVVERLQ